MSKELTSHLSRRERQIMDIIYRRGNASAVEVQEDLTDQPSYSTVRALLRILEEKGCLLHKNEGQKYVYYPVVPRRNAVKSAITNLLNTFFDNSVEKAVAALLEHEDTKLTEEDFQKLTSLIEKVKKEGEKDE